MRFEAYFAEVYKRADETKTTALNRLQIESGVSPMSCRRAVNGSQVRPETARKLAALTGGHVSVAELVDAPTAMEARAAQPIPVRGRPKRASSPGTKPAPSTPPTAADHAA